VATSSRCSCRHAGNGRPAIDLAERLLAELAAPFHVDDHELFVSGSIGIALSSGRAERCRRLAARGGVAMYRAKSNGRGTCVVYDGPWAATRRIASSWKPSYVGRSNATA